MNVNQRTQPYKLSFTTGGVFLHESVEIARIFHESGSWDDAQNQAAEAQLTGLPKLASNKRSIREIINRLSKLDDEELELLAYSIDRRDQRALLWTATCRAYRIVQEFAVDVIRDRYLSFQMDLPPEAFERFFEAKAEWNEHLAKTSAGTLKKLTQVLFRIMRETEIIDTNNKIVPSTRSPRVEALLEMSRPSDLLIFPGYQAKSIST